MDDKKKGLFEKRLREGWIRSNMMIEVLAVNKETAKSSLKKHIEKMEKEDKAMIYNVEFREIKKVKNPVPNISEAYSNIVELDVLTANYDKLIYMVMSYAPSSVEILEPEHIKIDMGEAQGILNIVADMVHKFAAAGLGGIIIGT